MDKLRRHRGGLRGSTTRLLSEASEILLQDTLPSSADLQERIDGLRDKDTALTELDKQIADALDGEEFDAEIVGALDYHERIVKVISRLRSALNARGPAGSTINETNQPRHAGTSDGSSNSMGAARSETTGPNLADYSSRPRAPALRVALPKLQVPVFSGENSEWQGFWENYEATIHTHPDVTGIEKFKYLKTYLASAAKRTIEGIRLTEANCNIAVKVLTKRFGRKELLIDDHIDSLLAIEPIETSSQVARLRDLYEQI
ncbi:hypothetical protein MTO96_049736 [Rhipicephalus appendiculatus]